MKNNKKSTDEESKNNSESMKVDTDSDLSEKEKFRTPSKFCILMTKHPVKWFCISQGVHWLFLIITLGLHFGSKVIVFQFEFGDIPMKDIDYEPYTCFLGFFSMNRFYHKTSYDFSLEMMYQKKFRLPIEFRIYYVSLGDNGTILTPETMQKVQELENLIIKFAMNEEFCGETLQICNRHDSIFTLLDIVNPSDLKFHQIQTSIGMIMQNQTLKETLLSLVGSNFANVNGNYQTRCIKSELPFQSFNFSKLNRVMDLFEGLHANFSNYFLMFYENSDMLAEILLSQIKKDVWLISGSIVFIYMFTLLQTRSLFVTFFSITSIFTTFCLANLVHTVIFGIKFFGVFHVLSIFLILGLGCDNIYVFFDRWKSFQGTQYPTLAHRLYATYLGVGWSMFITSLTTALAFFILTFTPYLTIFSFGLFVTLLVILNYFSVLIFFPSIILVYHLKFEHETKHDSKYVIITNFFKHTYFNFLIWKWVKYVILGIFVSIFIITIVFLARLTVSEHFPQLLISSTMLGRMLHVKEKHFKKETVDTYIQVGVVMGINNINKSSCKFWNVNCNYKMIMDTNFKINDVNNQEEYKKICDALLNADDALKKKLRLFNTSNHISCISQSMDEYFKVKYPNENFVGPWRGANFRKLIELNNNIYKTPVSLDFPYQFEVAMVYYLTDAYTGSDLGKFNFKTSSLCQKLEVTKYTSLVNASKEGTIGSRMFFSAILVNITVFQDMSGFTEKNTAFNNWIDWIRDMRSKVQNFKIMVCGTQMEITRNGYFHWIHVQSEMNSTALRGVFIGLLVSGLVILLATRNIFIFIGILFGTVLSTLSVISIIPISGWNLGMLESINITVVVGLTIDYLVHIGLAYNHSKKPTRLEKTQDMLSDMGISIISGAMTTLGATFFLFFSKVTFLFQFGIFVFITISFAAIYSLIFLPCYFLCFGPVLKQGKLNLHLRKRFNTVFHTNI